MYAVLLSNVIFIAWMEYLLCQCVSMFAIYKYFVVNRLENNITCNFFLISDWFLVNAGSNNYILYICIIGASHTRLMINHKHYLLMYPLFLRWKLSSSFAAKQHRIFCMNEFIRKEKKKKTITTVEIKMATRHLNQMIWYRDTIADNFKKTSIIIYIVFSFLLTRKYSGYVVVLAWHCKCLH